MELVHRDALRAQRFAKYGPNTTFPVSYRGIACGNEVWFDPSTRKEGIHRDTRWEHRGSIILIVEYDDGDGRRAHEYWIDVPANVTLDGRVADPPRRYNRRRNTILSHGGPGHEAAA